MAEKSCTSRRLLLSCVARGFFAASFPRRKRLRGRVIVNIIGGKPVGASSPPDLAAMVK
jgi:hypothetical protein